MKTPESRFIVEGGKKLNGNLKVESSKNAVLPILAASILHSGKVVVKDSKPISDVKNMVMILSKLGADCRWEGENIHIDSTASDAWEIPPDLASEIRSSVFMLGSILSRFKRAKVAYPGGCDIGLRPIDLHLKGLSALNVVITEQNGFIICDGANMRPGIVHLDFPSVGATENIMMAATKLDGRTQIVNAAKEPEIVDLQNFINSMGGRISGAGTGTITIEGVDRTNDTSYTPIRDRIIAGTYMLIAGITESRLKIDGVDSEHVFSLVSKMRECGTKIDIDGKTMIVNQSGRPQSCQIIETQPYPGFPTDLQAQMCALQAISNGTCMMIENLFETRYKHIPELVKMGANITIRDRCAIIRGVSKLHGAHVVAKDLRGGAALVLAALCANSTTIIDNINIVDRGYYRLEEQLSQIGAHIYRTKPE